ncbi:heavy metal translocating P-type ATPase [Pannus brasiliensis CCIBt3594]|uniref:Heavy metal translocating P-type ATPase n=1 Tax=Pannus brasiliensis CCIBt3594 TaxID=1427578 RepID=A0AAW9R042_9CHRO
MTTTVPRSNPTFQLVHAIPGRIRLRIEGIDSDREFRAAIESLKQLDSPTRPVKIEENPTTRAIVLQFPAESIAPIELLDGIAVAPSPAESEVPSLDSVWEELREPTLLFIGQTVPLLTGYATVQLLAVSGWLSIPAFLLGSTAGREALKQLANLSSIAEELSIAPLSEEYISNGQRRQEAEGRRQEAGDRGTFPLETEGSYPIDPTVPEHRNGFAGEPAIVEIAESERVDRNVAEKIDYTVKHNLPGRIRVKIPRLTRDDDFARKLTALLTTDRLVHHFTFNPDSGSIAVYYSIERVGETELKSHLDELIHKAPYFSPPEETEEREETPEERSPWENLTLPVITLGMSALWGMGVPIPPAVVAGSVAISTFPVVRRAWAGIFEEKKLNIDFLDLMAIGITTFQGNYLNPAVMLGLIEFGEAIREQSARSSRRQALDLLKSLEDRAWVERDGKKVQILTSEIERDETVIVYPGGLIPVDGTILKGTALVDEAKLTGESLPVLRQEGQTVYASTLVREGQIYIRAERLDRDTRAGHILQVMQEAPVHDTRIGNYAAAIADRVVVPTLLLSTGLYTLTGNLARAASILTLDFATGIRVSVPTTVLAALTYAARRGILIRSGRALEQLARVDTVVFDKTGTLTRGEPIVVSVEPVGDEISAADLLRLAAGAEQRLTHPVAEAIVRHAREQGAEIPERGEWDYRIGRGVRAEIDGLNVLVGSRGFLESEAIDLSGFDDRARSNRAEGNSMIYVAAGGKLQGAIVYRDPTRSESREVIHSLRHGNSIDVHLLTGDNRRVANAVAAELGIAIASTHAEAFPEQKVEMVKKLHEKGKTVAFVGDGINDSPALAYADVSVSFADGSEVARETADVVLMENNLRGLPFAIAIARQAMELIHQNTGLVAIPNLGAMVLAVLVGIPPLTATLVNNGSTIIAGLNGLRPLLTDGEDLDRPAIDVPKSEL